MAVSRCTVLFSLCALMLFCASAGCVDTADFLNRSDNARETVLSVEQQYGINLSAIPVDTPDLIETNGSYIAAIALRDMRARELLKHGGTPEAVAVLFHSCPRNDPYCDQDPKLVIRYGDIRFAFTVDERAGEVIGGTALVPNAPDPNKPEPTCYKVRDLSQRVDSVYLGDMLVMVYDDTSFLYLNESYGASPYPCTGASR